MRLLAAARGRGGPSRDWLRALADVRRLAGLALLVALMYAAVAAVAAAVAGGAEAPAPAPTTGQQ